jgi:hypothetical protein
MAAKIANIFQKYYARIIKRSKLLVGDRPVLSDIFLFLWAFPIDWNTRE